jgi:NodT family efflux transporter outer membrane factor (OMF) lipoprotein
VRLASIVNALRLLLLAFTTLAVCSCVGGSEGSVTALVQANPTFREAGPSLGRRQSERPWWETFGDRTLTKLVRQALGNNLEMHAIAARISQADAALRQAGGRLFPQLEGDGSYAVRWTDEDDTTQSRRTTSTNLGALLDWEIDLWGRLRSAREARRLEREATYSEWLGARLLLSASVAETYFEILEQKRQLLLLEDQIENNQTLLDLTELRFGQAQSSVVDVLQQREQLAATKTRVPTIEGRLQQLIYALEVLLGIPPGNGPSISGKVLGLPPSSLRTVGGPSDLLQNRPDLVSSAQRVAAIDQEIAEAIANRLPRLNLGGSLSGSGSPGINTVITNAVASAAASVFDAGIRKAEVARRQAALKEALADYSHDYLGAVRDVEIALLLERKQAERLNLLTRQLDTAKKLLRESHHRWGQGLTDYLPVLNAVVTVQSLEREIITSHRELLSSRVALHRAIGGPMDMETEHKR